MRIERYFCFCAAVVPAVVTVLAASAGCSPSPPRIEATDVAMDVATEKTKVERVRAQNHKRATTERRRLASQRHQRHRGVLDAYGAPRGKRGSSGRVQQALRVRVRKSPVPRLPPDVVSPASGGARVSMHFSGAPMRVVVEALAKLTGANLVVASDVADEEVIFRIGDAPWRDALSAVAEAQGWTTHDADGFIQIRKRDRVAVVGSSTATGVGTTRHGVDLLRFLHAAPGDVKDAATALFAGSVDRPNMSVDRRTGALMIKGDAEDVEVIASLAGELDRPERQVLIETFIVEAGRDLERSLGARLGVDYFDSGGVVRVGGIVDGSGTDGARRAVNLPIPAAAGGIDFVLDSDRLKVELTALEREGKTRIVSNPRVFTLNGREAVVFQGDEVPYFSVSESGTQTEFKEAGVRLAVTPVIIGSGDILLDVTVNKDTVDTRVPNPPITRRQIKTSLIVADGAMVVIGGIYFDTRVGAETRVPWFGRVPLLGRLFRRSQNTRDVKELLVFIAPKIVGASL